MTKIQRRLTLGILVTLLLGCDVAALPIAEALDLEHHGGEFLGPMLFGALVGQIAMVAAYLGWGADHWIGRWFTSLVGVLLIWYATCFGAVSTGNSFSTLENYFAILGLHLFGYMMFPYWVTRLVFRRQLLSADPPGSSLQFGIRHLLTWTAATAVVLAVGRWAIRPEAWGAWQFRTREVWIMAISFGAIALIGVVIALPLFWATLVRRQQRKVLLLVRALFLGLTTSELGLAWWWLGDQGGTPMAALLGFNIGVAAQVLACSLVVRCCGYRFVRRA